MAPTSLHSRVMRVGIVAYWFNRGQATVARHLRDIITAAGHKSFVFARPTRATFALPPGEPTSHDVWDQDGVTFGRAHTPLPGEYVSWARSNRLDVVFFDQNYEFDEIQTLRASGIKTIGRFVWESFASWHVEGARKAFSTIYSLTLAEQSRYNEMGISSPYISWGCHPELVSLGGTYSHEGPLVFIGGWLSARKPLGSVLQAYYSSGSSETPLIIKSQRRLRRSDLLVPDSMDELQANRRPPHEELSHEYVRCKYGASVVDDDVPFDEYMSLLSQSRALICPSRWEGLGLHFFEAMALGIPVISSSIQPITELIDHGSNGLLVSGKNIGQRKNGLAAVEPNIHELCDSIRLLDDEAFAREMSLNMRNMARQRSWESTEAAFLNMLEDC